jgi:hypothetical protein
MKKEFSNKQNSALSVPDESNFVCVRPIQYQNALSKYLSATRSLNDKIGDYEEVFGQQITEIDFTALKRNDQRALKASYEAVVESKVAEIKSPTLKAMDRKAYLTDGVKFFNGMAYWFVDPGNVKAERIRLENGKAVFNKVDAEKLMQEEFAINFSSPAYSGMLDKFNTLKQAYDDLCDHLVNEKDVIKINPKKEHLIRHDGYNINSLIYLSHTNGFEMCLNMETLIGRNWVG